MQSSIQYGFIAILLSLCLYFAFVAWKPAETTVSLNSVQTCTLPKSNQCKTHTVRLNNQSNLFLEKQSVTEEELHKHLVSHTQDCQLASIVLVAHPTNNNEQVVKLSSLIKAAVPDVKMIWISK